LITVTTEEDMATIRKIRSKWQVLIRKHNLKPIFTHLPVKEDLVSNENEVIN